MTTSRTISQSVPSTVRALCMTLEQEGYEAWIVGGCVRDTIMGRVPHDWDVATNASPGEVIRICTSPGVRVEPTGIQHGTVTVIIQHPSWPLPHPMAIEVTTFRGDGEYSDGRRPDSVSFVKTIQEDLARRDFTINAMAFRPVVNAFEGPAEGQFVDPFNGMSDIRVNRIKAVGDARERFMEDGLRVMRACRFSAQLGFFIAADTLAAMRQTPVREKCLGVAKERLFSEFRKLILAKHADHGLITMSETGLLAGLLPGVSLDARGNDFVKTVAGLVGQNGEETFRIRMAALLSREGGAQAASRMRQMRAPTADSLSVGNMVNGFWNIPVGPNAWTEARCRFWLAKVGKNDARGAIALAEALDFASFAQMAKAELDKNPPLAVEDLALNGTEVAEVLDVKPGKIVGEALRFLLMEAIKDPAVNKPHRLTKLLLTHESEFRH